jgi:creatinine amidohydrolase/Fe(II)-dependent formamide hydrolase-like protein
LKDFREVATAGWYGSPETITEERAREIIDAVVQHIVSSVEDVWKSLTERVPEAGDPPPI